jgi:hypothetical protein
MPQSVLLGAVFIGVLSALPVVSAGNCCCLWLIGGGILTAYLEQQNRPPVTVGRGATLGLLAGAAGAVIWLVITLSLSPLLAPLEARMAQAILSSANDLPPEAREQIERWADGGTSPLRHLIGFGLQLCLSVFSAAGGAIGATLFRRDSPPVVPPPLPPEA